jgi:type VI secretion system secreted protein Hcp
MPTAPSRMKLASIIIAAAAYMCLGAQQTSPIGTSSKPAAAPVARGEFTILIEGSKQGVFKAELTRDNAKDRAVGRRFLYDLAAPTGGKRTHGPLVITKAWGAASPQIFQAAASSETLKRVDLDFYQAGPSGAVELVYTIRLSGATITSLKQYSENSELFEDISLSFQKIDVEHKPTKTAATDTSR